MTACAFHAKESNMPNVNRQSDCALESAIVKNCEISPTIKRDIENLATSKTISISSVSQDCRSDGFVPVQPGSFWKGSPSGCPGPIGYAGSCVPELGRNENEILHRVTLTYDFEMSQYEITQGEFELLLGYNPSNFARCGKNCPVEQIGAGIFDGAT